MMLPSLSGLTLAPREPRNAAPAIGMDGDGEPGPSSMLRMDGSRGMGDMDLAGMLVGFTDEDTGQLERGVVTVDDGSEVTILLKDGHYKILDKDDVTLLRRATPEEMQAPSYRDPAPAAKPESPPPPLAPAGSASTAAPAKPLPDDLKEIEGEIKRVSAEIEVRRNAVVATITSYQEDIEAADAAQKEWKAIKEQKERAKIEEVANVPGAKEKLDALTKELAQANAKKLALLKKTKDHNDAIARALGQQNLELADLKQKQKELAQATRDASAATKRTLGEEAKAEQEASRKRKKEDKETQDAADAAEAARLGITVLSLKSKRSRQKSAAKAAGFESYDAYAESLKTAKDAQEEANAAEAASRAARTAQLQQEQAELDAKAASVVQKAEQCMDLICQARELRSQMEELGDDFARLVSQIEERGNCGLDQDEAPLTWMRMLAAKAMEVQEEVKKMGDDYNDKFELRDAAIKLAECRQEVKPLYDPEGDEESEGEGGDDSGGDSDGGSDGGGGGGGGGGEGSGGGGEGTTKVSRAPDSKGKPMSVQKRVGHLEAWSSNMGRDGLFGGAQAGDDEAMTEEEAKWFAEGDDPEYDQRAARAVAALD